MVLRAYSLTTLTTTNVFTWAASCEILAGCLHMFSQPCFNFHPWAILHFVSWAIRQRVNSQWPKSICYQLLHSVSIVFRGRCNKMMVQSPMQQGGPGEQVHHLVKREKERETWNQVTEVCQGDLVTVNAVTQLGKYPDNLAPSSADHLLYPPHLFWQLHKANFLLAPTTEGAQEDNTFSAPGW